MELLVIPVGFEVTETQVMFGNSFCFLFSKTCFWKYKEKTIFFCIFEIKNMFGQLKLKKKKKKKFFEEKNRKY